MLLVQLPHPPGSGILGRYGGGVENIMLIGLVLIVIGLVFFAQALGFLPAENAKILWPLLLIVVGLSMVSHRFFGHNCDDKSCRYCMPVNWGAGGKKRK